MSEPHEELAYWEARREVASRMGMTCLDCDMCTVSERYPCGYCRLDGEMRYADDPADECFRRA